MEELVNKGEVLPIEIQNLLSASASLRAELSERRESAMRFMEAPSEELFDVLLAEGRSLCEAARAAKEQEENE